MPFVLEDKQDRAFFAHISDLLEAAQDKCYSRFSGFLDLHQQKLAQQAAAAHPAKSWMLFGGYSDAERLMFGAFSAYETPDGAVFPIVPVTISFRAEDSLSHRDLLGAILALGIKREALGDILVDAGSAVCFLTEPAARVVEQELMKVGRCGVKTAYGQPEILPLARRYQDVFVQLSSLRLDCFTAALCNLSREKASQMLRSKLVQVDGAVTENPACQLSPGAIISLRGYGKFLFDRVERTTRSGRQAVVCKKYI